MTALIFPDVSQYNSAIPDGVPLVIARASIGTVRDTSFDNWRQLLAGRGTPLHAYHFLNSGQLGVSAQAQADYAFSVIGPNRPTMIDLEPNRGFCATLDEGVAFADRYRANGGVVHLCYLPRWSWSGWMGAPSLQPLPERGIGLVSSNYTTYSDSGPGWAPYGGVAPVQWQYGVINNVDWNAYLGSLDQYLQLTGGGHMSQDFAQLTRPIPNTADWMTGDIAATDVHTVLRRRMTAWQPGQPGAAQGDDAAAWWFVRQVEALVAAEAANGKKADDLVAVVHALASGGTSLDTAAVISHIDQRADAESAVVAQLQAQNVALAAQVHDLTARLAKAAQDAAGDLTAT
jgi:hypothetical protein